MWHFDDILRLKYFHFGSSVITFWQLCQTAEVTRVVWTNRGRFTGEHLRVIRFPLDDNPVSSVSPVLLGFFFSFWRDLFSDFFLMAIIMDYYRLTYLGDMPEYDYVCEVRFVVFPAIIIMVPQKIMSNLSYFRIRWNWDKKIVKLRIILNRLRLIHTFNRNWVD